MLKSTEPKEKNGLKDIVHHWAKNLAENPLLLETKKDVPQDSSDKKQNVQHEFGNRFATQSANSAQV